MTCPTCNSDMIKKCKAVYQEGSRQGNSKSTTTFSNSSIGNAYTESTHQSQTILAKQCTPPKEPYPSFFFHAFAIIITLYIGSSLNILLPKDLIIYLTNLNSPLISWIILLAVFISIYILRYFIWSKYLWRHYNTNLHQWNHRWICFKCGEDFENYS